MLSTQKLRVLFLTSFFPKPDNPVMGTWALGQATALTREPIDLKVVSFTAWVPRIFARTPGARAYANCPDEYQWGPVHVQYPRWLLYPVQPLKRWAYPSPRRQLSVAWRSAKGVLCNMVESWRPHVIYCHHTLPNGYMAHRLHERYGTPYVITDHDFDEIADCEKFAQRRAVFEPIANNAALMIAVASRMEQHTQRLFPKANTRTVYNGIGDLPDNVLTTPRPAELQGKLVIFSCAMLAPRKGMTYLIEAFGKIAAAHPTAMLRIAGEGPQLANVQQAVANSGVADRIQMLGRISHEQVYQNMAWADVFALVGWNEPFATVYIEAMGTGTPIITCNDGGINDVVRHGQHGLTVPPRDVAATATALDQLLSDQTLRQTLGSQARQLVASRLTWRANAKSLYDIFQSAAQTTTNTNHD